MSDKSETTDDITCPTPGGHRYGANGRCDWCDAERGTLAETVAELRAVTKKHGIEFPSVEDFVREMRSDD